MRLLVRLLRALFAVAVTGLALVAVAAFLGFAVPVFDVINHLQPAIFPGVLAALVLGPLLAPFQPLKGFVVATAATGFLASAVVVVPEFVSGFVPRAAVAQPDRQSYKLMTWNIFGENRDTAGAARMIHAEDPDIVAIQEYLDVQHTRLHPLLVQRYPYWARCAGGYRAYVAIYSRLPFADLSQGACENDHDPERTARVIARFSGSGGASFTVVSTHLDWPVQVSPLFSPDMGWRDRIDAMTRRQRDQFAVLAEAVAGLDGPVVLAGDFNATPWSYALRRFAPAAGLVRHTYNLPTFPTLVHWRGWRVTPPVLPIDHVFTRGGLEVHEVRTGAPAGSDHRPVIAWFSVSQVSL